MGTGRMDRWQECSTDGCSNRAAFTTRTKPAWCSRCLEAILHSIDLEPAEPFPGRTVRWLTRCRLCQAECHYLLNDLLKLQQRKDEPACRRCFWTDWSADADLKSGTTRIVSIQEQVELLEQNNYQPVEPLFILPREGYPIITKCRSCGRQKAQRIGDIAWGCPCAANPNPAVGKSPGAAKKKNLLLDSNSPALAWWDAEANEPHDLETVTMRANRVCAWVCPDCGHHFSASVRYVTQWLKCPKCDARNSEQHARRRATEDITPIASVPELLAAWDDEAAPHLVMVGDHQPRRFQCAEGHHPRIAPSRYLQAGCPSCRSARTRAQANTPTLAEELPEIALQWHPHRNGKWTPEKVGPDSKRLVWWKAACCGHEWQEEVRQRNKRPRYLCPECNTILDSLAWLDPGMAAEWSPGNPETAWQVRPSGVTGFMPSWICAVDPLHQWKASLASRYAGSDCPECRQVGKSKIELEHLAAAQDQFGSARSGPKLVDKSFTKRKQWSVDILVETQGVKVAIEYDGVYWHSPQAKQLVDLAKSRDLLAAGYLVVRLRENGLPPLGIEEPGYLELQVYSDAPRPESTMTAIDRWMGSTFRKNQQASNDS